MAICSKNPFIIYRYRDTEKIDEFKDESGALIDLNNYGFVTHIRATKNSPTILLELTIGNGGVIINAPSTLGQTTTTITDAQSSALPYGVFYYETYWVTPAGKKQTVMAGPAVITGSVARP